MLGLKWEYTKSEVIQKQTCRRFYLLRNVCLQTFHITSRRQYWLLERAVFIIMWDQNVLKKTEHASSTAQVLGNPSPMPKRFPEDILRNVLRAKSKRHLEGWWSIVRFPLTFGLPKVRRGTCLVEYDHSIHHQSFPRECSIQPFPVNYDRIYKKCQVDT